MKSMRYVTRMAIVVAGLSFALNTMLINAVTETAKVDIYWNETHQTIDGFGTAQGGTDYTSILYNWPEPQRSQIVDLGFSQASGIGLTILRSQITPALESFPGFWSYKDDAQVWLMKEAVKRGPVQVIASVWSPPAWMKDSGTTRGGSLDFGHYQAFAKRRTRGTSRGNPPFLFPASLRFRPGALSRTR